MQTANTTGRKAGTTEVEPNGNNSGDCAFCGERADGIDARTGKAVCRSCGVALDESDCEHETVRRYGRVTAAGATIERRCDDCGRTLSLGGDAR